MGYQIIHDTLYTIFPEWSIDEDLLKPLGYRAFIQRVLIPEVSARLIMRDMGFQGTDGMNDAVQILRDSAKYGVALFPVDPLDGIGKVCDDESSVEVQEDPDIKVTAADSILMKRALKRWEELQKEREADRLWDKEHRFDNGV